MDININDRYVLFSLASVAVIILICTIGSFNADTVNGNGMTEMEGMISSPSQSQNGTVFILTDLDGKEYRCFYGSVMPQTPALCRLIGSFSADGNMFFVDRIVISGTW
ncbi:MAG: hypothetical protein LBE47_03605 [Methanomassiliicoccaceae archaeon]|jgi:hypothetical protein|nr:hypothetical protein [Methanomassiliicoccaceae archaeon]